MMLQERGIEVKYHHHEVGGPGQLEIEIEPGPLRKMADATMMIKYLVKNAAFAAGKTATFLPKPIYGEAGTACTFTCSCLRTGSQCFMTPVDIRA